MDEGRTTLKGMKTSEHDHVVSRLNGKKYEIMFGPQDKGNVPANPFASKAQARFLHAHPEKLGGKSALAEWDRSTDFSHLPKKKKRP